MLTKYLPNKLTTSGAQWWFNDIDLSSNLAAVTEKINQPSTIANKLLYKNLDRRLIFKHSLDSFEGVVKAFPLQTLRHRIKHKKYAYSEAQNLLTAKMCNIPVPEVYAYGISRSFGLVKWNAVLIKHIPGQTMAEFLQDNECTLDNKRDILKQSYPLFKSLLTANCLHLDFKPDGVIMGRENTVLDFQYVMFHQLHSPELMALQAGHFAWSISGWHKWLSQQFMNDWFAGLLEYLSLTNTQRFWDFFNMSHLNRLRAPQKLAIYHELAKKAK